MVPARTSKGNGPGAQSNASAGRAGRPGFAGPLRARRRRNRTFQAVGCTALLALKACMLVLCSCGDPARRGRFSHGRRGAGRRLLLSREAEATMTVRVRNFGDRSEALEAAWIARPAILSAHESSRD